MREALTERTVVVDILLLLRTAAEHVPCVSPNTGHSAGPQVEERSVSPEAAVRADVESIQPLAAAVSRC